MGIISISRKKKEICKICLDFLLFYTTSFFVLLAIFSLFTLIFLVPFFIDPAWSTLRADFDPKETTCTTISGTYLEGKSNCDWSSCEEGCTKTVFTCWKIMVDYARKEPSKEPLRTARLLPNVKGCGYPPKLNCREFVKTHSKNGSSFPCFVSRNVEPVPIAVPHLDLDGIRSDLFYCLAIPIPCFLLAMLYLCLAYFCIYGGNDPPLTIPQKPENSSLRLSSVSKRALLNRPEEEDFKEEMSIPSSASDRGRAGSSTHTKRSLSGKKSTVSHFRLYLHDDDQITEPLKKNQNTKVSPMKKIEQDRIDFCREKYSAMQYYYQSYYDLS